MMMYELHVPLVVLSNRALQRGPKKCKDPKEITKDLKVFKVCLIIMWFTLDYKVCQ